MEREVKFRVSIDPQDLKKMLIEDGFSVKTFCDEEDIYFDKEGHVFSTSDQALRLRKRTCTEGSSLRLTYKGPRIKGFEDGVKAREEIELRLDPDDYSRALALLRKIGFTIQWRLSKKRLILAKEGMEASIDFFEPLGVFFEIEMKKDDAVLDFKRLIEKYSRKFSIVEETYLELYLKNVVGGK
ncbi:MAG: class IV adenylate cyclase [Thermosphaera sp.]